MSSIPFPETLRDRRVHLVGAKGTGMTAFAEILCAQGARLSGSDVADVFYTDAILAELGVAVRPFDEENVTSAVDFVIHSAAYDPANHPELVRAASLKIPIATYTEALGAFSARFDSSGISGVHGKTTTTALVGSVLKELSTPATVLAGSAVSVFGGRSTMIGGDRYFVAETCEYRRHFLSFHPKRIVLTSVEPDHQDYFPDYASIRDAFVEYVARLPSGGQLIYCADDPGACDVVRCATQEQGRALVLTPYGAAATGPYRLTSYAVRDGRAHFSLAGFPEEFNLRVPGKHVALDAAAALALAFSIEEDRTGAPPVANARAAAVRALSSFGGSKRRSEIVAETNGILIMDDYAHHPTAIRLTLAGLREFYKGRRLIVDFMSHTYSRTQALLAEFASSFGDADEVILHKIYASARETPDGRVDGRTLFDATKKSARTVRYFEEPLDALEYLVASLKPGDVFITMGAGDNFKLGQALAGRLNDASRAIRQ